jgi:hypothetical protein
MYVNAKTINVETVPGNREGRMKERRGRGELKYIYLLHCKIFCKSYNVPPPSTTIVII